MAIFAIFNYPKNDMGICKIRNNCLQYFFQNVQKTPNLFNVAISLGVGFRIDSFFSQIKRISAFYGEHFIEPREITYLISLQIFSCNES